MKNLTPSARPILDFTPVPRRYRHDGWTPERQRAFIVALAETGSVTHAAARVNMAKEGAYQLRLQPGAEGLCAAWEAALDHGVHTLADIAIDRARDGVPVPIFHNGVQVGERRWYNDRLLMFVLKHHMPSRYGADLPGGTKNAKTLQREWRAEQAVEQHERQRQGAISVRGKIDRLRGHLLSGIVQDPAKRAAWELICGPTDWSEVEGWDGEAPTQFADDNMTKPSTIATLAVTVDEDGSRLSDRLFGKGEDGE